MSLVEGSMGTRAWFDRMKDGWRDVGCLGKSGGLTRRIPVSRSVECSCQVGSDVSTYHSSHDHRLCDEFDFFLVLLRAWAVLCHRAEAKIDLHEFVIS